MKVTLRCRGVFGFSLGEAFGEVQGGDWAKAGFRFFVQGFKFIKL